MEVKIRGGIIKISHKLKKNETYRFSKGSKIQSLSIFRIPQIVGGFSNICEDLKGILVIDYDSVDKSIIKEDYQYIQKKFSLPPSYLFTTKEGNYHIICLYKDLQSKIFQILTHIRADSNFKDSPLRTPYRSYVLRLSNKKKSKRPKFVGILGKNVNLDKEISSAHLKLLQKLYKLPKINYKKEDGLRQIHLQNYET